MAESRRSSSSETRVFVGEYDEEGVYVYQAYNDAIADYAVEHQRFGGPAFNPGRMTWIKPSFAWVLYRSGYASKPNQTRVLKIKLPHVAVAKFLGQCACQHGGGGTDGRVQWDPARDVMSAKAGSRRERVPCVPRMLSKERAIQIGLRGPLSAEYVSSILCIEDVTDLSRQVFAIHQQMLLEKQAAQEQPASEGASVAMRELARTRLPVERPYLPHCSQEELLHLGM